MIEIIDIHKSFNANHVLKGISSVFHAGKTNLIIGQSGSGKTVLLKSLVGLHFVDSGIIKYSGKESNSMNDRERQALRQEIGMVFQGGALFDSLSVEDNVRFPLDMFTKQSSKEKSMRVDYCLEHVNLKNAHKLYPSELSGGMQKRVAIARAIALNPKYLFCDEPNSGLDPVTATVIDNLIQSITQHLNITTIINTHDMNSVIEIGDNVIFIYKGEKCWEGNSSNILTSNNKHLKDFVFASELLRKIGINQ